MMKERMSLETAKTLASNVAHGLKKFGAQYNPPLRQSELVEVISVLHEHGNWDAPTREELTKANRQLAACNARYEKLKNKIKADSTPGTPFSQYGS